MRARKVANEGQCRPPWKKGERGNPHYAGRVKGSRNKINQAYIDAFCEEFEKHGAAVFARVRKKMPHHCQRAWTCSASWRR